MQDFELPVLVGTLVFLVMIGFLILFIVLFRRTQYRFELERQRFKQAQLEAEVEVQEQTLVNVSRDLHDNLGQVASLININLKMLEKPEKDADVERLGQSQELLKGLIADIRSLSFSLNSENLAQLGLVEVIKKDVERVRKSGFVDVEFDHSNYEYPIAESQVVFIYRMFQEFLNNALKHAEAKLIHVGLTGNEQQAVLSFRDNGKGMALNEVKKGNGLLNLERRCKLINATLDIKSEPKKGTHITISIPRINKGDGES